MSETLRGELLTTVRQSLLGDTYVCRSRFHLICQVKRSGAITPLSSCCGKPLTLEALMGNYRGQQYYYCSSCLSTSKFEKEMSFTAVTDSTVEAWLERTDNLDPLQRVLYGGLLFDELRQVHARGF